MPTSPYAHIEYVVYVLLQINPSSILDIGLGNGKMGFIARDVLDVIFNEAYLKKDWKVKIDGIEIHEPYIQEHQRFIYDNIYIGDAFEVIDRLDKYDLIIIGDTLEHFEKTKGWLLLDKCSLHSNKAILINIPLGECPQPDIYGNEFERHLSTWLEEDLEPFASYSKIFTMSSGMEYGVFLIAKDRYIHFRIEQLIAESNNLIKNGKYDDSIRTLRYAIRLNNNVAELYNNLGLAYTHKRMNKQAISSLLKAIDINPNFHIAHFNLANVYKAEDKVIEAINHYLKALEINPNFFESAYRLGVVYKKLCLYDEAIVSFEIARTINPNNVNTYINMGAIRHLQGKYDDAIDLYNKALLIDDANPDAHWNLALTLLLKGDFKRGWQEYQWRWRLEGMINPSINIPPWDGKSRGDSILLITEQGLGDAIQFIRYADLLKGRGFKVFIQCQSELVSLFKTVRSINGAYSFDDDLPSFDYYAPTLSLPYLFNTDIDSIPSNVPYIFANEEGIKKFGDFIIKNNKLKVGIAWAGKSTHKDDINRSMRLSTLEPLFDIEGTDFYSLQKGDASIEGKAFDKLIDFTDSITDFADTSGLIYHLDLIITVDTAVAHLAGAMGKDVWILIPFSPDWRWLLEREDSPWYPTARLFRQTKHGEWHEVIKRVVRQLISHRKSLQG